jgi:Na+/melibiose symporter-like transporter
MAKVKQPLEENGIHRAKMWEIMMYALNNTSTNTYMLVVGYISYFLIGIVGLASVLAGSIVTIMRVWDGVTDPFVGMMVDKTNGKFGKNRPFIVIGQIIMFATTFVMFNFIPKMGTGVRFVAFIIIYMVYILGYTCQCVVTKSAQTCLTNDPKQRPIFAMCDTVYNIILMNILFPIIVTDVLVPKFTLTAEANAAEIASLVAQNPALAGIVEKSGGSLSAFYNPGLFTTMQLMFGGLSAVFAVCAIIALWRKDNPKYFGLGTTQKVGIKDYVDTLAHNRAIQMLVVSASTDKLFMSTKSNATVMICLFGIIFGNYAAYSSYSQITSIPICLISLLLMNKIARQMGQKASMLVGTWGGIIGSIAITLFLFFFNPKGDASKFSLPAFRLIRPDTWGTLFTGWTTTALIFVLLVIAWSGVQALSSSIVITMTADCADYEVYRTGKYVPGLMGTLFSFVDKLVSSFAPMVAGVMFSMCGYTDHNPVMGDPVTPGLRMGVVFCAYGMIMIGLVCNLIAMKFYPLTKEKMAEIQAEIGRIKAEAAAKQA